MIRCSNRRPARVAKPALLRSWAGRRTVAVVVDDDEQVCAAYVRDGWPVRRADWMTRPESLAQAQEDLGRT